MVTLFNRKELVVLFSHRQLYAVRSALDGAGIPCHTKASTPMGRMGGRGRGNPFQNPDAAHDYRIYVRREDYDRAVHIMQNAVGNSGKEETL